MFPNPMGHYWGSAANPHTDVCTFAVAASNGSIIVYENESTWSYSQSPSIHGRGEAVTIDWLSPTVILKGCRAGAVRLWDTRIGAESTEPRILHPSSINHVRSVDENLVVVAGLNNEVSGVPCA